MEFLLEYCSLLLTLAFTLASSLFSLASSSWHDMKLRITYGLDNLNIYSFHLWRHNRVSIKYWPIFIYDVTETMDQHDPP